MDELLASGALTDLSNPVDDIQAQLDKVSAGSQVDNELAAMKLQLAAGAPAAALSSAAAEDDTTVDGEIVDSNGSSAGSPAAAPPGHEAAATSPEATGGNS